MKKYLSLLALPMFVLSSCSSDEETGSNNQAAVTFGQVIQILIHEPISAAGDSSKWISYCGGLRPSDFYPIDFKEYRGITENDFLVAKHDGKLEELGEPIVHQTEMTGNLSENLFKISGEWFSFEVTDGPVQTYTVREGYPYPWLETSTYVMHVNIARNTTGEKRLLVFDFLNNYNTIQGEYGIYLNYARRPEYFIEQEGSEGVGD